jgi:BirA family transcriptional regulator, biotin operon repressor / biotin---[acetyl-CoA-carboxylase] ligase
VTTLADHPHLRALTAEAAPWRIIEHLDAAGSTNDVAAERVREGAGPGLVVVADHQTAGRGRAGHRWEDVPGDASLLVSAVLPAPASHRQLGSLAAALAVADAVRVAGAQPALKWPNDVLLDDHKCAGVLLEAVRTPGGEDVLIVGVGLDLDWRGTPREGEAGMWTSVAEVTGDDVDRGEVLALLLRRLARWMERVDADRPGVLAAYRDGCVTVGRDVEVTLPDGATVRGRVRDLDAEGRLVVAADDGDHVVTAGDVRHARPAAGDGPGPEGRQ